MINPQREVRQIIIVIFSTLDEPLYNSLQKKSSDITFVNNIDQLPDSIAITKINQN